MKNAITNALKHKSELLGVPYLGTLAIVVFGGLIENIVKSRFFDRWLLGLPIAAGLSAAYLFLWRRRRVSWSALLSWIIPSIFFVQGYIELNTPPDPKPWTNLLGTDCGSTECLYKVFYTLPLLCGATYSVAALALKLWKGYSVEEDAESQGWWPRSRRE